jgi:hypothetical protein
MLERVTVQSRIGKSATTKPLDERIDQYESIGWTLRSGTLILATPPGRALTVGEIRTLSDFDNVTVRIADVAADLAILGNRPRDELRPSAFP